MARCRGRYVSPAESLSAKHPSPMVNAELPLLATPRSAYSRRVGNSTPIAITAFIRQPGLRGMIIAKIEERIMPDRRSNIRLCFSDTNFNFVCPWHGYEYDIKTGEYISDRRLKLPAQAACR